MNSELLALDRASVRTVDDNGFLHVAISPITKEQIAPYYGHEIPGWEELGLERDRVYYGYRPAEELSKPETLKSFEGIPIHVRHHADFADAPAKDSRVGATGTDAKWDGTYITNSLAIFDKRAQDLINEGTMRELSAAYHYRPDMTAGEHDGKKYDFIMRDIRGNHLALVEEGRAGADVLVYDHKTIGDKTMHDTTVEKLEALMGQILTALHAEKDGEVKDITDDGCDVKPLTPEEQEQLQALLSRAKATEGATDEEPDDTEEPIEATDEDATETETEQPAEPVAEDPEVTPEQEAVEKIGTDEDAEEMTEEVTEEVTEDEPEFSDEAKAKIAEYGVDLDNPALRIAFAEGVKYGERKEKTEPEKLDKLHESEGEKKALGEDAALFKGFKAYAKKQISDMVTASEDVRKVMGRVNLVAYDSAADIYMAACKHLGLKATTASARDVFRAYGHAKTVIAQDAKTATKPDGVSALLSKIKQL